ncbi:MAG: type II secretion system protein [Sedimentisphaerales bacterium]|nr:type II secretion system protein [Sedimentisphaerales bacterium]
MGRKGFTLLELLIVMSIIVLMMSILLPCLMKAKESTYELLFANKMKADKEGKVMLEIQNLTDRKPYYDLYMIEITPPRISHIYLKVYWFSVNWTNPLYC